MFNKKVILKIFFGIVLITTPVLKSMESSSSSSDESSNLLESDSPIIKSNEFKQDDSHLHNLIYKYRFCFESLKTDGSNIASLLLDCMIEWMDENERASWYKKFSPELKNKLKDLLSSGEYLPAINYSFLHKNSKKFKLELHQTIDSLENIKKSPIIKEILSKFQRQFFGDYHDMKRAKLNFTGDKIIGITKKGAVNLLAADSNELLRIIKHTDRKQIKHADLMPDDKVIIVNIDKKKLESYDIETGNLLQTLKFENKIKLVGLNSNGTLLGVVSGSKAFIFKRDFNFLKATDELEELIERNVSHQFFKSFLGNF